MKQKLRVIRLRTNPAPARKKAKRRRLMKRKAPSTKRARRSGGRFIIQGFRPIARGGVEFFYYREGHGFFRNRRTATRYEGTDKAAARMKGIQAAGLALSGYQVVPA